MKEREITDLGGNQGDILWIAGLECPQSTCPQARSECVLPVVAVRTPSFTVARKAIKREVKSLQLPSLNETGLLRGSNLQPYNGSVVELPGDVPYIFFSIDKGI